MGLAPGLPATELKRSLQVGPQTRPRVSQVPPVGCTRPFPAALRADLVTLVLFPALSASGNDAAAPQPPARPVPSAGMAIRGTARAGSRGPSVSPPPQAAFCSSRSSTALREGPRVPAAGPWLRLASAVPCALRPGPLFRLISPSVDFTYIRPPEEGRSGEARAPGTRGLAPNLAPLPPGPRSPHSPWLWAGVIQGAHLGRWLRLLPAPCRREFNGSRTLVTPTRDSGVVKVPESQSTRENV